jgi:hypothetical protein
MSEPIDVNFEQWDEVHSAKAPAGVKDTNGETWVCDEGEHEQPYPDTVDGSFLTEADKNQLHRDDDQGGWLQIPEPLADEKQQKRDAEPVDSDDDRMFSVNGQTITTCGTED